MLRRTAVKIGPLTLGGRAPIVVQSMTNTKTHDVRATLAQIKRLATAGCELVRVAVPDQAAAAALPRLQAASVLPLVADIHFDADLALAAIAAGIPKIRINPGNLGLVPSRQVARAAAKKGTVIRVGVNAGSLPPKLRAGIKTPVALGRAMAKLAIKYADGLVAEGLKQIVLSVKASEIKATIAGYQYLAEHSRWPLHLGITEAGGVLAGSIKTAAGLAPLLLAGIGDTLRVSLTGDPVQEIYAADVLLRATGARRQGVEIIACPTCGRTQSDLNQILHHTS